MLIYILADNSIKFVDLTICKSKNFLRNRCLKKEKIRILTQKIKKFKLNYMMMIDIMRNSNQI